MARRHRILLAGCALALLGGAVVVVVRAVHRPPVADPNGTDANDAIALRLADGLSCEIYVPPGFDATRTHPLVFGTSPGGSARELLAVWRPACDRFQWILLASNNFRNGPFVPRDEELQLEALALVEKTYPVDPTRVYATGLSGAGMHAHALVANHPQLFRGAVVNTGMMPHRWPGNDPFDAAHYPRDRPIVFLASPADFRYREMADDRRLLEGLGWKVHWLEFAEGHAYAPPALYEEAARWLTEE